MKSFVDLKREFFADHIPVIELFRALFSTKRVLVVGCGDGRLCRYIARFEPISVVGVDDDASLIARAKTKFGKRSGIDFQAISRAAFEWPIASLDLIVCVDWLAGASDPEALLEGFCRALTAQGRLVVGIPASHAEIFLGATSAGAQPFDLSQVIDYLKRRFDQLQVIGQQPFWGFSFDEVGGDQSGAKRQPRLVSLLRAEPSLVSLIVAGAEPLDVVLPLIAQVPFYPLLDAALKARDQQVVSADADRVREQATEIAELRKQIFESVEQLNYTKKMLTRREQRIDELSRQREQMISGEIPIIERPGTEDVFDEDLRRQFDALRREFSSEKRRADELTLDLERTKQESAQANARSLELEQALIQAESERDDLNRDLVALKESYDERLSNAEQTTVMLTQRLERERRPGKEESGASVSPATNKGTDPEISREIRLLREKLEAYRHWQEKSDELNSKLEREREVLMSTIRQWQKRASELAGPQIKGGSPDGEIEQLMILLEEKDHALQEAWEQLHRLRPSLQETNE